MRSLDRADQCKLMQINVGSANGNRTRESRSRHPVEYRIVPSCTGFRDFESELVPSNPGEFCVIR